MIFQLRLNSLWKKKLHNIYLLSNRNKLRLLKCTMGLIRLNVHLLIGGSCIVRIKIKLFLDIQYIQQQLMVIESDVQWQDNVIVEMLILQLKAKVIKDKDHLWPDKLEGSDLAKPKDNLLFNLLLPKICIKIRCSSSILHLLKREKFILQRCLTRKGQTTLK